MWDYWVAEKAPSDIFKEGTYEFTPVELDEEGNVTAIVDGMCLVADLEEIKTRAKRVVLVDDRHNPTKFEVLWEAK